MKFNAKRIAALVGLVGVALVGIGAWQLSPPAGLIAVGLLLILDSRFGGR